MSGIRRQQPVQDRRPRARGPRHEDRCAHLLVGDARILGERGHQLKAHCDETQQEPTREPTPHPVEPRFVLEGLPQASELGQRELGLEAGRAEGRVEPTRRSDVDAPLGRGRFQPLVRGQRPIGRVPGRPSPAAIHLVHPVGTHRRVPGQGRSLGPEAPGEVGLAIAENASALFGANPRGVVGERRCERVEGNDANLGRRIDSGQNQR